MKNNNSNNGFPDVSGWCYCLIDRRTMLWDYFVLLLTSDGQATINNSILYAWETIYVYVMASRTHHAVLCLLMHSQRRGMLFPPKISVSSYVLYTQKLTAELPNRFHGL